MSMEASQRQALSLQSQVTSALAEVAALKSQISADEYSRESDSSSARFKLKNIERKLWEVIQEKASPRCHLRLR